MGRLHSKASGFDLDIAIKGRLLLLLVIFAGVYVHLIHQGILHRSCLSNPSSYLPSKESQGDAFLSELISDDNSVADGKPLITSRERRRRFLNLFSAFHPSKETPADSTDVCRRYANTAFHLRKVLQSAVAEFLVLYLLNSKFPRVKGFFFTYACLVLSVHEASQLMFLQEANGLFDLDIVFRNTYTSSTYVCPTSIKLLQVLNLFYLSICASNFVVWPQVFVIVALLTFAFTVTHLYTSTLPKPGAIDGHWINFDQYLPNVVRKYSTNSPPYVVSRYVKMRDGVEVALDVHFPAAFIDPYLPKSKRSSPEICLAKPWLSDLNDTSGGPPGCEADSSFAVSAPTFLTITRYNRRTTISWPYNILSLWHQPRGNTANIWNWQMVQTLTANNYIVVVADSRGTGASFGNRPVDFAPKETGDFEQIIDWIRDQFWYDGNIGTGGISYDGMTGLYTASRRKLQAVVSLYTPVNVVGDLVQPGGMLCDSFVDDYAEVTGGFERKGTPGWHLLSELTYHWHLVLGFTLLFKSPAPIPGREFELHKAVAEHSSNWEMARTVRDLHYMDDTLEVPADDLLQNSTIHMPVGGSGVTREVIDEVRSHGTPAYIVAGYCDSSNARGALRLYDVLAAEEDVYGQRRSQRNTKLILGPWTHAGRRNCSPFTYRTHSRFEHEMYLDIVRFLDCHLRANGCWGGLREELQEQPVHYWAVGEEQWKTSTEFPPGSTRYLTLQLSAAGSDYEIPAYMKPPMASAKRHRLISLLSPTPIAQYWPRLVEAVPTIRRVRDSFLVLRKSAQEIWERGLTGERGTRKTATAWCRGKIAQRNIAFHAEDHEVSQADDLEQCIRDRMLKEHLNIYTTLWDFSDTVSLAAADLRHIFRDDRVAPKGQSEIQSNAEVNNERQTHVYKLHTGDAKDRTYFSPVNTHDGTTSSLTALSATPKQSTDVIRYNVSYERSTGTFTRWAVAKHPFRLFATKIPRPIIRYGDLLPQSAREVSYPLSHGLAFQSPPLKIPLSLVGSPLLRFSLNMTSLFRSQQTRLKKLTPEPSNLKAAPPSSPLEVTVFAYLYDLDVETGEVYEVTEGRIRLSHRATIRVGHDMESHDLGLDWEGCAVRPAIDVGGQSGPHNALLQAPRVGSADVVYQFGRRSEQRLSTGGVECLALTMEHVAWVFQPNHRVMLTLAGSDIANFHWKSGGKGPHKSLPERPWLWEIPLSMNAYVKIPVAEGEAN